MATDGAASRAKCLLVSREQPNAAGLALHNKHAFSTCYNGPCSILTLSSTVAIHSLLAKIYSLFHRLTLNYVAFYLGRAVPPRFIANNDTSSSNPRTREPWGSGISKPSVARALYHYVLLWVLHRPFRALQRVSKQIAMLAALNLQTPSSLRPPPTSCTFLP